LDKGKYNTATGVKDTLQLDLAVGSRRRVFWHRCRFVVGGSGWTQE
jgi:hypothetical protein